MIKPIIINGQAFSLEQYPGRLAVVTQVGNINIKTWVNEDGRDHEMIVAGEYKKLAGLISAVKAVDAVNDLTGRNNHHALIA